MVPRSLFLHYTRIPPFVRHGVYSTIAGGCTTPYLSVRSACFPMPVLLSDLPAMGRWPRSELPPSECRAALLQDQNEGYEIDRLAK